MPFVFSESELTAPSVIEQAPPPDPINWRALWRKLKKAVSWELEYYNGLKWIDCRVLLDIDFIFPYENTSKITLDFHSKKAGAYRLTFGIKKYIQDYVNRTSFFQYNLTYKDYTIVFDWRDLKEIPNLIFKHGIKNGYFWFRIQHNHIPANKDISLDPTIILSQWSNIATWRTTQLKTFQNPRGKQYYYTMFYNESNIPDYKLVIYKSKYGETWAHETTLHTFPLENYESSSLWIVENSTNAQLYIYFVYTDSETLYYRQGNISDSSTSITLGNEQILDMGEYARPTITLADNGYVWICVENQRGAYYPEINITSFTPDIEDWQTNGASPYLRYDDFPTNYVYQISGTDGDRHSKWNYAGGVAVGTIQEVLVWFNCTSSGNDEFDVSFYLSGVWRWGGTIQPNSSWAYHSVDVTHILNTAGKANLAPMSIYYDRKGAGDDVYIDRSYMEVTTTSEVHLRIFVSNVQYFPSSTQWIDFIFENDGVNNPKPSIILPLHAVSNVVVLWRNENYSSEYLMAKQCNYSGALPYYRTRYSIQYQISGGHLLDEFYHLRAVVDSENDVHTMAWRFTGGGSGIYLYSKFIADQGFDIAQQIPESSNSRKAMSMSIDTTVTPNIIYAFYTYYANAKIVYWKSCTINNVIFPSADEHYFHGGGSTLTYLTASYNAGAYNNIQLVFSNPYPYPYAIIWNQIPVILPPEDDLIFILFLLFIVVLSMGAIFLKKKR